MIDRSKIRPVSMAGLFYPARKLDLERDISLFLENAPVLSLPRPILGMVLPHAKYFYCGGVSARAYRQIMHTRYEVIIIIAASSKERFDYASIYPGKALQTPLGNLPIDYTLTTQLTSEHQQIRLSQQGYRKGEYTLEVQLPFIYRVQPTARIVPVMLGAQNSDLIQTLHNALVNRLQGRTFLMIASTNLSESYPIEEARAIDRVAVEDIEKFSPYLLYRDIKNKRCEMTAYGAVLLIMRMAKEFGAKSARVLLYRNSGDVTGRRHKVEGYLSGIFY